LLPAIGSMTIVETKPVTPEGVVDNFVHLEARSRGTFVSINIQWDMIHILQKTYNILI
jgi:hypothetical protein